MARESVLLYSMPGAGKSFAHLLLGKRMSEAHNGRAFILDTDRGLRKALEEHSDLIGYEPEMIHSIRSFDDAVKGTDLILRSRPTKNDLIVVEMVNKIWEYAQGHFTEKVYGRDAEDYFVEARRRAEDAKKRLVGNGLDPMVDWTVIKRLYFSFLNDILSTEASVIFTASAKELIDVTATAESRDMYAGVGSTKGFRPEGNKSDHHQVDTVMFLQYDRRNDARYMWTVKDRGRMLLAEFAFTDLFDDYFSAQGVRKPWEAK